jgi:hypothetical protein
MIVRNMWVGKGLEILPTLSSLLTELFVLSSVLFCCSWTLTKCAYGWLFSRIKFILCLSGMLSGVDWQYFFFFFFCKIPVYAAQHLKRMKISTTSRQNVKILQEQNLVVYEAKCAFVVIATVLQNICHNYKLVHDSVNSDM